MHGPATWWYENGQKMLEKNYKDGKLDGLLIMWHENGTEKDRKSYKDGEEVQD
jgi:antitoxin component YwqK of YwqJK toxin-antitoxin module